MELKIIISNLYNNTIISNPILKKILIKIILIINHLIKRILTNKINHL